MLKTLGVFISSFFFLSTAYADIEWNGVYRFEGTTIKNSELGSKGKDLAYGLHHLTLRPKIVAGDGLTIYSQFDVFNDAQPNSQMGSVWGGGVRSASGTPGTAGTSNVLSDTNKSETIQVSQLYLTLNHEFGQLIVGRAPLQFGLGMTYSAGRGLFDHYYSTSDLVGYKLIVGNLWFLPMIGKASEGLLNRTDDLNDYMIQMQYENPDSDIEMGVFYKMRRGGDQAADAPLQTVAGGAMGGVGAVNSGKVDVRTVNLYVLRDTERFRLGLEASFISGQTGVVTATGEKVTYGGFGVAAEAELRPEGSRFNWGLKAGTASGDDPTTDAKFEGFMMNRNYDVGFLMFNHPLGQDDFLRTGAMTGNVRDGDKFVNSADTEAISNVIYFAPRVKYAFNDKWSLENTVVTGFLGTNPLIGQSFSKDLGYEWDIGVNFAPRKGVMWVNQVGLLFPGAAWEGGGMYDSSFAFGVTSKAAISF